MGKKGKKRGHRSEETKQKIRDAHRRRREAKERLEKREKPKDIREELADYLGLNPKKVSEASQEAPDGTEEGNTEICV